MGLWLLVDVSETSQMTKVEVSLEAGKIQREMVLQGLS